MAEDVEIIALDAKGEAHRLALVDERGHVLPWVIRGDPPARFVHHGRAWHATGLMTEPPGQPLSYEYRPTEDIT